MSEQNLVKHQCEHDCAGGKPHKDQQNAVEGTESIKSSSNLKRMKTTAVEEI